MAIPLRIAFVIFCLSAAACGDMGSPVGPTPVSIATPAASTPSPAPVSQTVTGTWYGIGRSFTVTDIGTGVTGMLREQTTEVDGVTLTETADITGSISGSSVTLRFTEQIVVNGTGVTCTCATGYTFTGTLAGNSLSGMLTADTPSLECGHSAHVLPVPQPSGPATYVRQ